MVVAPHKDLLMNPTFQKTAKRTLPKHEDDLITIDEFDIINSFLEVELTQARLEYLRDSWEGYALGDFAKALLDAILVQNAPFTGISFVLDTLSDDERVEIKKQLGQLCVNGKVMDADDIEEWELGTGRLNGVDKIKQLPVLERDPEWNLLIKLELFFNIYKHAETAPIAWEDNTLTFYLPPLPTYTKARVILMSATLKEAFFRQVFRNRQEKRGDVEFLDLVNTEWHKDARVFQLRTNRNPRRTLLEGAKDDETGKWSYTNELTKTGQAFMDRIKTSIDQSEKKSGFIGHKQIVDTHTKDWGVPTANFGGLVGLNKRFYRDKDDGILLHILGTPNIGQDAVHTAAKLLYGMTDAPLNFTRNDDGTYDDENVQAVADAIIQDEQIQAVGRAGLVKNPSDVVIWSSYEIPSITHRDQTIMFDETDWENAKGNLDDLAQIVKEREDHEKAVAEAIAKGDTKAVAELKGVEKSQAYNITKESRKASKAERDAKVIELHEQGLSQRKIHALVGDELSISLGTIASIIKVHRNSTTHVYNTHVDRKNCAPTESQFSDRENAVEPQNSDPKPIPLSEYSSLDDETALLELERCKKRSNYNGEALLRNLLRKRGVSAKQPVEKIDTGETMLTLFDWDFKTVYLHREEIAIRTDVSKLIPKNHPLQNIADDEVLRVDTENDEIIALSIVNKSHIFEFTDAS